MTKRFFDSVLSLLGLILLTPLFLVIAVAVKAGDGGPIFFRQERIGRGGRPFWIWKFRTMRQGAEKAGPSITSKGDHRITAVGRRLRAWKLDELPQLFNVLRGEMALVGPRPEVARYVALYQPAQRRVLELRPGITDLATLEFRDEEAMLSRAPDPEKFYVEYCLPKKIELNLRYAAQASLWRDTCIILRTLGAVARPGSERSKL